MPAGAAAGSAPLAAAEAAGVIERARHEQLGKMNGDGSPGDASSEGQDAGRSPGEGEGREPGDPSEPSTPGGGSPPPAVPGGKPQPGGGEGSDALDPPRNLPNASLHAPEQVDAASDGPARGAVRAIERFARGHRDADAYAG